VYAGSPARPLRARPKARILELEAELHRIAYTPDGRYVPRRARASSTGGR